MTFEEAQDRVKIGHFTRKGGKIRGVIHVGANDGEEIPYYLALGAERVLAFEPNLDAWEKCYKQHANGVVTVLPIALGMKVGQAPLNVTLGDGKGSSFLAEKDSPYEIEKSYHSPLMTFRSLNIDTEPFNTLVIDVQGMEHQVLRGFDGLLSRFDFLNIECSQEPMFYGEHSAQDVIDFLSPRGFYQDSPIETHDDIMFIRKGAL